MNLCDMCASIKSKKENNLRCPFKKKGNTDFCGKHQINPIYFKENIVKEEVEILSVNHLIRYVSENKNLSVNILRKSIKNCYLKNFINTKLSKKNIIIGIKQLIEKERYYLCNEDKIIKIQSTIRMFLKKYRYSCFNDVDILTMNNKMDIENPYFYRFYNKVNQKYYGYDIRLLENLINSNYKSCPYTLRNFEESEINIVKNYIDEKLLKNNIFLKEEVKLSQNEIIENNAKELFYKINMLDNYTNHKWFFDLDLLQLMKLYISAEDIWNYRSLLSDQAKFNIIGSNHIFNIPVLKIKKIKSVNKLREILIKTFDIMISCGIDINEKKLGAILVLSSLVEISVDAANALPHLIQV